MICDANKSKCKHRRYIVSTVHTVYSTILASELVYSGLVMLMLDQILILHRFE